MIGDKNQVRFKNMPAKKAFALSLDINSGGIDRMLPLSAEIPKPLNA